MAALAAVDLTTNHISSVIGDKSAAAGMLGSHHSLQLTQLLSMADPVAEEGSAASGDRRGATTKGKTQDDQNVGKRLKKKKVRKTI